MMVGLTRRSRTEGQLDVASSGIATCADQLDVASPGAAPCADSHGFRPHDLVWVADPAALHWRGDLPGWCAHWLQCGASTPVVLRRENVGDPNLLPVGIRGVHRHQRQAAYLERGAVARLVRPEDLVRIKHTACPQSSARDVEMLCKASGWHELPCDSVRLACQDLSAVLFDLFPALTDIGLPWGPTGGLGFALATGLPALHAGSDIDLLVRAPAPLSQEQVYALAAVVEGSARPIDVQIDTGFGGFAFKEWMACDPGRAGRGAWHPGGGPRRVLLKTGTGPVLVHDPWRPEPTDSLEARQLWSIPARDSGKAESEDPSEQEETASVNAARMAASTSGPLQSVR